jgi:Fe-S oxidoreductase
MSPRSKAKKAKEGKAPKELDGQLQEVETCFGTSCNMCERDCPVYRALRNRTYTSRGKNRALLGVLKGHYPLGKEYAKAVFECTLCGLCDARCALGNTERFTNDRGPEKDN